MREFSKTESYNQKFFSVKRIPFVIVCLTSNIIKHSIFDAKRDMRNFLKEMGIHDFHTQGFGQEAKVMIPTYILTFRRILKTQTSLYRAGTRGDERMWFGSAILPLTDPDDLYAVTIMDKELYIINITKIDIEKCSQSSFPNPIKEWVKNFEMIH